MKRIGDAGGGRLVSDGADKLYLSIGDYGLEAPAVAQDKQSNLGKILEISISGGTRTVSKGHRNPQGLALLSTGVLLATEHGPSGGDELNQIIEGANYGWPLVTLGTNYDTYSWRSPDSVGRHSGFALPQFAWVPSIGVSNLIEVRGFHQRWDGDILVASLKAQSLFRLRLSGMSVLYSEPIWTGQRIRDVAQLSNGTIVLWTDDSQLLFLSVNHQKLNGDRRLAGIVGNTTISTCMFCHHFGRTMASDTAPSLSNLFQRRIGSDNYRYSAGLRSKEGNWDEKILREFLDNPAKFANGTSMPSLNLEPHQIDEVIQDLKRPEVSRFE
jgi:cytochrome c2